MLRRIAGSYLSGVVLAIMPVIILNLRTGQNGFLTGALVGAFLLAFLERRPGAGVPLGLMIIKPHLNVGAALLALLELRWSTLFCAAAVVLTALIVPTLIFGTDVWFAFVAGVRESSGFLAEGYYPLFRMTSLYASFRSFGFSANTSLILHGAGALLVTVIFIRLWRSGLEPRLLAAAACITSLFVSPYNYDYDLTILGVAIAAEQRNRNPFADGSRAGAAHSLCSIIVERYWCKECAANVQRKQGLDDLPQQRHAG